MPRILPLLLALLLLPVSAFGLTPQDLVALSKAGVSETVLLAMIERDNTIFAIDANQLIALKRDGLSEKVVIAMLRSGRDPQPPSSPGTVATLAQVAPSAEPAADGVNGPLLVGVGHGPDRPNTYHNFDTLSGPTYVSPFVYSRPYLPPLRVLPTCSASRRGTSSPKSHDAPNCRR
jgi:hypothetical protein